ncbi:hypothetical protein TNCT_313271 [Trichonephila clavata]|uniref:Uncharacterized protein n=1 Tax=Trichonephila clavata TaxID=2740835 RepID=A0A8X6IHH2_TRICU|nr:hypothetical protein TNCT_313271 [Trichonephila clavata]
MSAVALLLVGSPKPNRSSLGRRRKTLIPNLRPASVLRVRSGLGVCEAEGTYKELQINRSCLLPIHDHTDHTH